VPDIWPVRAGPEVRRAPSAPAPGRPEGPLQEWTACGCTMPGGPEGALARALFSLAPVAWPGSGLTAGP